MTKPVHSTFWLRHSFVIRAPSFVICLYNIDALLSRSLPMARKFTIEPLEERLAPSFFGMHVHHHGMSQHQSQFQAQFQSQFQSQHQSLSVTISVTSRSFVSIT